MKTTIDASKYTAHLHPGKFEGETAATEYFHEQMLNGDGETIFAGLPNYDDVDESSADDVDESSAELFHVNAEESEAFDLPIGSYFMIREDSQGFVYGTNHVSRQRAEAKFQAWLGL